MSDVRRRSNTTVSTKLLVVVLLVIVMFAVGISAFFFYQYSKTKLELSTIKDNPQLFQQQANAEVIESVNKLIRLPTDEQPTVVTIFDLEQLADQPFFSGAKEGDKVLIYNQAKKAVLYDPVDNIIVEVAPLILEEDAQVQDANEETPLAIVILNGTQVSGVTTGVESILDTSDIDLEVVVSGSAQSREYGVTTVSAVSDKGGEYAGTIASFISAQVASIPDGEVVPDNTDLVIIVGNDKAPAQEPPQESAPEESGEEN